MSSTHATDAEEEYLQALFWLQEAELPMTGANVARAMQLAPPTVHEMIGRLIEDLMLTGGDEVPVLVLDDGDVVAGSAEIVAWAKANPAAAPAG